MKTSKVALSSLFAPKEKIPSTRDRRRMAQEAQIERVIRDLMADSSIAIRIAPEDGEKPSTIRARLRDLKKRMDAPDISLIDRDGALFVYRKTREQGK